MSAQVAEAVGVIKVGPLPATVLMFPSVPILRTR